MILFVLTTPHPQDRCKSLYTGSLYTEYKRIHPSRFAKDMMLIATLPPRKIYSCEVESAARKLMKCNVKLSTA